MNLGMTGTRNGMTTLQKVEFRRQLAALQPTKFHHGDCIGADQQSQEMAVVARAEGMNLWIVSHPPIKTAFRAFTEGNDEVWPVKDYLVRDRDIVNQSSVLLVFPKGMKEERRSGTWTTYRYAKERHIERRILFPDGSVKVESEPSLLDGA